MFYEFVLPIIGLSALFAWEGDVLLKIPLAIVIYRSCVIWSELASLERGAQEREAKLKNLLLEENEIEKKDFESEPISWASFVGMLLQILFTVGIAVVFARFI